MGCVTPDEKMKYTLLLSPAFSPLPFQFGSISRECISLAIKQNQQIKIINIIAGKSVSLATMTTTNQQTNYPLVGFVCVPTEMDFISIKSTSVSLPKKNQQISAQ